MTEQRRPGKYLDELRERAVRMVFEAERDCGSQWAAIASVAEKLGPTPETVRKWVRRDARWMSAMTPSSIPCRTERADGGQRRQP